MQENFNKHIIGQIYTSSVWYEKLNDGKKVFR